MNKFFAIVAPLHIVALFVLWGTASNASEMPARNNDRCVQTWQVVTEGASQKIVTHTVCVKASK